MGEATAEGGEVAYLRHAEVGVEENPGTLRCALRTGLRKSAVALRRESANRGMTFLQPLFGGFFPMAVYCAVGAIRWVMADDGVRQPPKVGEVGKCESRR